jgi:hypothetical protein
MDHRPVSRPIGMPHPTAAVRRRTWLAVAASVALLPAAHPVRAQGADAWPSGPLHVVVGYPAGGLADALARAYGEALAARLGQPVVVENKPGAGHWGVPTFVFEGEPYFGQDRMDLLLWRLRQRGLRPRATDPF